MIIPYSRRKINLQDFILKLNRAEISNITERISLSVTFFLEVKDDLKFNKRRFFITVRLFEDISCMM